MKVSGIVTASWLILQSGLVSADATQTIEISDRCYYQDTLYNSHEEVTAVLLSVRGGETSSAGWRNWFQKMQPSYRSSLEDQLIHLEQQLRVAHNELNRLREQHKDRLPLPHPLVKRKTMETEARAYQQRIQTMQSQIQQLEEMKAELQELLTDGASRIEQLQEKLKQQQDLTKELKENYEQQIEALKERIQKTESLQKAQLEALVEERVAQATEAARQEALLQVEARVNEVTQRLQAEHAVAMKQEKAVSMKAIEAEKNKMRQLVKALAIREKKLLAQAERLQPGISMGEKQEETTTEEQRSQGIPILSSLSSSFKKPQALPTTRGSL